jgi:hemerythrin-like domain-containing protein
LSWVKEKISPIAEDKRVFYLTGACMTGIASTMAGHHATCDDLFAAALAKATQGNWDETVFGFARFRDQFERHIGREETVLFPAFELTTGSQTGPTALKRQEHNRKRALLAQIELALKAHDQEGDEGYASTLLIMMQQHNLKEENVLYPMFDAIMADRAGELVSRLDFACGQTCPH